MHRLISSTLAAVLVLAVGCGGNKKEAESPEGDTSGGTSASDTSTKEGSGDKSEKSEAPASDGPKKDECGGFDIGNVEDVLLKNACEEATKPESVASADLKGKLEVTLAASPAKPAPGGKVDLLVTFSNKSKEPLTLHFKIDPVARFEVETYDVKKNKRADMPAGNPPPPPKGATQPPPSEPKTAKVTIAPNGFARARVPWEAVKMRWAPEKYKGTPPERGYPRAAAGPLAKGKYVVKVITPLVGVTEGVDREMSAPKIEVDVGG